MGAARSRTIHHAGAVAGLLHLGGLVARAGVLTSPLHHDMVLGRVQVFRVRKERLFGNVWDVITMPFDWSYPI